LDALVAKGKLLSETLVNQFKGYLVAPDKDFYTHIKQKKERLRVGARPGQKCSHDNVEKTINHYRK